MKTQNVVLVALIVAVAVLSTIILMRGTDTTRQSEDTKEATATAKHSVDSVETACQFFEKYLFALRNSKSLEKEAPALNDNDRANLAKWFANVDFGKMSGRKRADCEECRDAIVKFLTNPPKDGFAYGYAQGGLIKKVLFFLVDFELSGAKAIKNGYPQIAEAMDAHLDLGKALLMINNKVDPSKSESRPVVKIFSEYLVIYFDLFNADLNNHQRSILAQTALLSMRPENLTDANERKQFEKLHESLLRMSNLITEGENASMEEGRLIVHFNSTMGAFKITPEELENATSKSFADTAKKMSELLD